MLPLTAIEVIKATKGKLISGDPLDIISNVSTDSRTISSGDFFVPLVGEHYNGHDYIDQALLNGASGFFTSEKRAEGLQVSKIPDDILIIGVKDTLIALHGMAIAIRSMLDLISIGITGSTGKTCTKDILKSIVAQKHKTVANVKNYNNEIGVPLTVLSAGSDTEVLIAELAMRGRGQISELARITQPSIGIVTNIGLTHFEILKSIKEIARSKAELVQAIPKEGTLVLNYDDPWSEYLSDFTEAEIIYFGLNEKADVRAENINLDEQGHPSFLLCLDNQKVEIKLEINGRYNILNSLAAIAASWKLKLSIEEIVAGLKKVALTPMRMDIFKTKSGVIIINDAYNANPASMSAALQSLVEVYPNKRKIAILGDMAELGSIAKISHQEIGCQASNLGIDILLTIGKLSEEICKGANTNGNKTIDVQHFDTKKKALIELKKIIKDGDVVLVKASRSMEMEKIVNELIDDV